MRAAVGGGHDRHHRRRAAGQGDVGEHRGGRPEQGEDRDARPAGATRSTRHITYLKAACPARNSAGPPRISHADGAACDDGDARTFWSPAAATMIPATITGWMRW